MRAAFVLWALLAAAAAAVRAAPAPVATASGLLQGATIGAANQWLGVPYAQPPVGPLRWQRPQPPLKWSGVRPALAFENSCMQAVASSIPQSEDCLYVNIWAPANATSASSLPVMFWIHGGAWEFGSPIDYNAAALAPLYNVIYVTVAYRLGALGFLAEPYLLQREPLLGALGLADAQAGLQWVQTNIAAFGGDPGRVTVFGESAGSGSVNLLNTMPSAKGLFRNAIGESGVFRYLTVAAAVPQGLALSAALNCSAGSGPDPVTCLLAQPAQRVMQVLPVNGDIFIGLLNASDGVGWTPLIDGTYIVGQPINMALKGLVNAQHYILGTNAQEGNGFIVPYFDGKQPSPTEFEYLVNNTFGNAFLQPAYQTYSADIGAGDYVAALADMANDFFFQCQRLLMARAVAAAGVPTYTYLFSYPYTEPGKPDLGAVHGDEVYFVWGAVSLLHMNASEAALSGWMSSAWAAFAAHDDPNAAALPVTWPRHNATTETPIDFDLTLSVLPAPYRAAYCPMWLPALIAPVA